MEYMAGGGHREFWRYVRDLDGDSDRPAVLITHNDRTDGQKMVRALIERFYEEDIFDLYVHQDPKQFWFKPRVTVVDKSLPKV